MLREQASAQLQLPLSFLDRLARTASHLYKEYRIPKRAGGERIIHHPARELKAVQRFLLRTVIEDLPVHAAALAYRRGIGTRASADRHAAKRYLLRLDAKSFFPSLTAADIRTYQTAHVELFPGWTEADTEFFVSIVCRAGRLTIGAPTSPGLSNALCRILDARIADECQARGVTYSRYADDFFFSCDERDVLGAIPTAVTELLARLPYPTGLIINSAKTVHSSRKHRREVAGLILTSTGETSLGRTRKRSLATRVFIHEQLSPDERISLAGLLAYARSVEPAFINRLILKYGPEKVDRAMHPDLQADSQSE